MAQDLSNTSMAALLTDFTDLVQRTVKTEMPQENKLEQMADILEGVTDELKTYCTDWKTATLQAEDGAKQMAQRNEEIEEMKKNMAEKNEELEERRKKIQKQEEELLGRILESEVKERLFEERRVELEKKEKLLQQQLVDLERTELNSRIQHARLQSEAALVQSKESKVVQEWHIFQAKVEASKEADIERNNWEEGLRKREENLELTYQSVLALNDRANKSLAAVGDKHDEDPKARAAASKTKADWQRTLVHHSVSRYDESRAKRRLGPGSPEKPISKRRRQNSVGSAGMLTNSGPLEPLPENIMDRVRSPRGLGKVVRHENARHEVDTPPSRPARTPTGARGLLGSSIESSSSMGPATATGQTIFNPESSSPGTLMQSSQSTASATDPPGLSEALDEVKDVWRQIEFPVDWDLSASDKLLRGLKKNTHKNIPKHFRPAGLLDSSSDKCLIRRLTKIKSAMDNGDGKSCSACKKDNVPCVRASLVAEDLADVAYNAKGQEKRWKLTIREV